jgi:hypothetical protein
MDRGIETSKPRRINAITRMPSPPGARPPSMAWCGIAITPRIKPAKIPNKGPSNITPITLKILTSLPQRKIEPPRTRPSLFLRFFLLFDCHVLQFTGFENIPTFLAFHVFGFLVAGNDLHPGMFALFWTDFLLGGMRRLAKRHKLPTVQLLRGNVLFPNLPIFCGGELRMSSAH